MPDPNSEGASASASQSQPKRSGNPLRRNEARNTIFVLVWACLCSASLVHPDKGNGHHTMSLLAFCVTLHRPLNSEGGERSQWALSDQLDYVRGAQ